MIRWIRQIRVRLIPNYAKVVFIISIFFVAFDVLGILAY